MVIFFERHANIIKSANCISLSLYASYNAGFFILHLGAIIFITQQMCYFRGSLWWKSRKKMTLSSPCFSQNWFWQSSHCFLSLLWKTFWCVFLYVTSYITTFLENEELYYCQMTGRIAVVTPPKWSWDKEKTLFCAWHYSVIKTIKKFSTFSLMWDRLGAL